jgi:hypothetical protein
MNNSYHQPEEVLGLEYLHENHPRSSTHSHIIHEAAVAAGVAEDNEMMEINPDSSYASSDSINSAGKSSKINANVVLTSSTSPVYAVKRVPTVLSTTSEGPKAGSSNTAKRSNFKPNHKRKRRMSSQNANVSELVSCPKCDKMVKKTSLKVHITRTHLEEGTILVCPICNKQISSKGVYYKHMYGHRQKSADVKFKNSEGTNSTQSSIGGKPNESRT